MIPLGDVLKHLSHLQLVAREKVRTIYLPLRENPQEYHIQDIGRFESMHGESLWRKKVSTYDKIERLGNIPKVRGGCHLKFIFSKGGG